jgi:transposase-like protein
MTSRAYRDGLYGGRRFPRDIIVLWVRWYVTYRLSYRDLVEMRAERGVYAAHSTIFRCHHVAGSRPATKYASTPVNISTIRLLQYCHVCAPTSSR